MSLSGMEGTLTKDMCAHSESGATGAICHFWDIEGCIVFNQKESMGARADWRFMNQGVPLTGIDSTRG